MKLTFDEKKLLYAYGNPDLALTRKRLYEVAAFFANKYFYEII